MTNAARPGFAVVLIEKLVTSRSTILLVDEDPRRRALIGYMLKESGYHVVTAPSGKLAETLVDELASLDLVITATIMQSEGAAGIRLADYVAQHRPPVETILISHYSRELLRHIPGFNAQPNFLRWPFEAGELLAWVRRLIVKRAASHGT